MFSKKILIVDDDKAVRTTLTDFLNLKGYTTKSAGKGKEALKIMETFTPNLVLLDYMMPLFSGLEIFPRLRKLFPYIKVIIITGRGSEEIAVRALKMGVDDYLTKPFDLNAMNGSIDYYLRKQREEIIWLNGKYDYPLDDEILPRYEFLRLVHSRPDLGVKTASAFFTYSRQDFYNYLTRFKEYGLLGLFGVRELKNLCESYKEDRLKEEKIKGFSPFPFLEPSGRKGPYRLDKFLNWRGKAQVKLEMIREVATSSNPHVGAVCRKYGITREAFYQNYRAFQKKGIFGILPRRKGRPRKQAAASK